MSKNKKFQKSIVPAGMKGKVFDSLSALGSALGFKDKEPKEKIILCPKCGSRMNNVPGTNVYLCSGVSDEGESCNKRLFWREKATT